MAQIRPARADDRPHMQDLLTQTGGWPAGPIYRGGEWVDWQRLPALVIDAPAPQSGYLIYAYRPGRTAEIVALVASPPQIGLGTALLDAFAERCEADDLLRITVTLTNDRLEPLRFFLRRAFVVSHVGIGERIGGRTAASGASIGQLGIPIRDEITLTRQV